MAKAKVNKPSKSASIREFLKANRKAKAQAVVDALAAKGITVTAGLVYEVKKRIKGKRGRRIAAAAVAKASPNGAIDPIKLIQETRALAEKAGGIKRLKELLEALS